MANGENNLNNEINANIDQELSRINEMIEDMHMAEIKAMDQGLLPGQYDLSAMTQQEKKRRVDEENKKKAEKLGSSEFKVDYGLSIGENTRLYAEYLSDRMTGDFTVDDVLNIAGEKMKEMYDPETARINQQTQLDAQMLTGKNRDFQTYIDPKTKDVRYVLNTFGDEGVFKIGGEDYKFLDYTDKAANQVIIDENNNVSEDSPVKVIGLDASNKPVLIAKKGYNGQGIKPMKFNYAKETLNPYANAVDVEYKLASNIDFKDDPDKMRNIIMNSINPVYNSVDELIDDNAVTMVKKLQDTGLLREKPKEPMQPVPVEWGSEKEKQEWLEKYELRQEAMRKKLNQ